MKSILHMVVKIHAAGILEQPFLPCKSFNRAFKSQQSIRFKGNLSLIQTGPITKRNTEKTTTKQQQQTNKEKTTKTKRHENCFT